MNIRTMLNPLEITALIAVIISLIAIVLYPYSFNKSLVVDVSEPYPQELVTDSYSGGSSIITRINSPDSYKWRCIIRSGQDFPYCSFKLDLIDPQSGMGLDLSSYDKITIDYHIDGNAEDTIRLFLRTHEDELTEREDKLSYKFNKLEFKPSRYGSPVTFRMSDFNVAHWWVLERDLPIESSRLDFSEVMFIEVLTGTHSSLGKKEFEIRHITFTGKVISKENFYLIVITILLFSLFLVIGYRLFLLKSAYKHAQSERDLLKDIANHDQLSRLLNRHALDKLFAQVEIDWNIHHINYSLIVADIDHFKSINDNYGHAMGDKVIKNIADILRTYSREQDYIGRWGGEEFVILLPSTSPEAATACAEKLRIYIEAYNWPQDMKITASFGVSSVKEKRTLQEVFAEADRALYHSKANGRNKVTRADKL
ncbi:GGDEF domain-containing protein [Psychromonas sp. MME1]|uniref:GGDEF domain-containing protein n=1 Tax=Psychromonas sp. MME1 TaxID=3231032 RepID=UPI0034E21AD1